MQFELNEAPELVIWEINKISAKRCEGWLPCRPANQNITLLKNELKVLIVNSDDELDYEKQNLNMKQAIKAQIEETLKIIEKYQPMDALHIDYRNALANADASIRQNQSNDKTPLLTEDSSLTEMRNERDDNIFINNYH